MEPLNAAAANPVTEDATTAALDERLNSMWAAHVAVKIPKFNEYNVKRWFTQAEHQFRLGRITSPATKFSHIYTNLPEEVLNGLSEETASGDDYERIKREVIQSFSESKPQLFDKLTSQENFLGQKPTLYLRKIQQVANQLGVGEEIVRIKFLKGISDDIRPILVTYEGKSLEEMARVADTLMSYKPTILPVSNVKAALPPPRDPVETSQDTNPDLTYVNHVTAQHQQDYSNRLRRSENFNQDRNASRGPQYNTDIEFRPYNGGNFNQDRNSSSGFQSNDVGLRPYHSGQRQVTCRSHIFFGPRAKQCKPWCWLNGTNPSLNVLPSSRPPSRSNSPHRSASPSPAPRNTLNSSFSRSEN